MVMSSINPRVSTLVTLTYYSSIGAAPSSIDLLGSTTLTAEHLPTLTADGYIHVGWYSTDNFEDGTKVEPGYILNPTHGLDIYAKWVDKVLLSVSFLQDIADSIRAKNNVETKYKASEMAAAISLPSGTDLKTCALTVEGVGTDHYPTDIAYTTVNDSGDVQYAYNSVSGSSITVTCLRNSIVAVKFKEMLNTVTSGIAPHLLFYNDSLAIFKIGDVENIVIHNSYTTSGGGVD